MGELYLHGNNLGAAGAKALASSLKGLRRLTVLYLHGNKLGYAGATELAPCLKGLTRLTKLNLSANFVGGAGADALFSCLKGLTRLTYLDLEWNRLGSEWEADLRQELSFINTLISFHRNFFYTTAESDYVMYSVISPRCY